jgi:YNFM family putative membrane transporter
VAICGLARSLDSLTLARFASGITVAWILPISLAYIGDAVPYGQRQQLLGRFLAAQILGQLFGQAAGGVLGDYFGWRNVFFLLAGLLAVATLGLFYELWRNPVTHARNAPVQPAHGFVADYTAVLRSPWARAVIAMGFLESAAMFGAFTYVGADLHLRFGVGFTVIGLFVGTFAIGGLLYSLSVKVLVRRFGPVGLASGGGALLALSYVTLAAEPTAFLAPLAITAIGLGFYMLHNTLQTNATQMTPEARGTAVAVFSSALYLGQMVGVAVNGAIFDRFTAVPVFLTAAIVLLALGLWFSRQLKKRSEEKV